MISNPLIDDSGSESITFLLGENGTGKSRRLRWLAEELIYDGVPVIAISNTVFDRFPFKDKLNYSRLSPYLGKGYAKRSFKRALYSQSDPRKTTEQIMKVLDYAGLDQRVNADVVLAKETNFHNALERMQLIVGIKNGDADLIRGFFFRLSKSKNQKKASIEVFGVDDSTREGFIALLRNESTLKKEKILSRIDLFLSKGSEKFEINQASSGELSLIATYAFLATRITEGTTILIDEPENSLHPRWQSEYCRRLLDQFYLYRPRIIIATHSPIMVSGAEMSGIYPRVFALPQDTRIERATQSIEGILMDVFGVLVPASHYLSEKVTQLLNNLQLRKIERKEVLNELDRLWKLSYDPKQRLFLDHAKDLAEKVNAEITSMEKNNEA